MKKKLQDARTPWSVGGASPMSVWCSSRWHTQAKQYLQLHGRDQSINIHQHGRDKTTENESMYQRNISYFESTYVLGSYFEDLSWQSFGFAPSLTRSARGPCQRVPRYGRQEGVRRRREGHHRNKCCANHCCAGREGEGKNACNHEQQQGEGTYTGGGGASGSTKKLGKA